MDKMNKCKYCGYCKRVYVMFGCEYLRRKVYFCTLSNTPISGDGGCENRKVRKQKNDLSAQRFDAVIDDINRLLRENSICDQS